jgi:hypothetical protein
MASRDARRSEQATSAEPADGTAGARSPREWYRRVAFWRAMAGMAFASALACAMVAAEFSSALVAHTQHYRDRLRQLSSNISAMRGRVATDDREVAGMRITVAMDDKLGRILAEPDARLIRLTAPGRLSQSTGVIAFSPGLRLAAIELAGLPQPATGGAYNLWWTRGKHGPIMAAHVRPGTAGEAVLMIALPANEVVEGAVITADSSAATDKPDGAVVLDGMVARAPARIERARHRSG